MTKEYSLLSIREYLKSETNPAVTLMLCLGGVFCELALLHKKAGEPIDDNGGCTQRYLSWLTGMRRFNNKGRRYFIDDVLSGAASLKGFGGQNEACVVSVALLVTGTIRTLFSSEDHIRFALNTRNITEADINRLLAAAGEAPLSYIREADLRGIICVPIIERSSELRDLPRVDTEVKREIYHGIVKGDSLFGSGAGVYNIRD